MSLQFHFVVLAAAVLASLAGPGFAQSAQMGADVKAQGASKLRIDYVHYRPARWEKELVKEFESAPENEGGLLYIYFTNVTDKPVDLRFWRVNGQDESYWRLNHLVAWDRLYNQNLGPGASGVLEIDSTQAAFGAGQPFDFAFVDSGWKPAVKYAGELKEDPLAVSFIRVLPGMKDLEVHVRYTGSAKVAFEPLEVVGCKVASSEWTCPAIKGPGNAIAKVSLAAPLNPSQLIVTKVNVREGKEARAVYAHRRAFEDRFPIGVWSGNPETYERLHRLHIDTFVEGGKKTNPFFAEFAPKLGLHCMTHTGQPVNADTIRELADQPAVDCWMLQDEPDWSIPSDIIAYCDRTVRMYNDTKPTFLTLCRNARFFEYAPIADIPCMDHYSVTAPSSSKWPKMYGTRLEETAWYTRDLKIASEPKPIWIWTQGIANWGERPRRPVPTPDELAAQLVLNLGRGAKGILWFNYDQEIADKYPDAVEAMGQWGRVMEVLREDFLASEPAALEVKAPEKVDVAPLVTRDKVILCVTNLDYELDPAAYPFAEKKDVRLKVALPEWIQPAAALRVSPDGIEPLALDGKKGPVEIAVGDVNACAVIVLVNDPETGNAYRALLDSALKEERPAS
jgi:hypothetical protein